MTDVEWRKNYFQLWGISTRDESYTSCMECHLDTHRAALRAVAQLNTFSHLILQREGGKKCT